MTRMFWQKIQFSYGSERAPTLRAGMYSKLGCLVIWCCNSSAKHACSYLIPKSGTLPAEMPLCFFFSQTVSCSKCGHLLQTITGSEIMGFGNLQANICEGT